MPAPLPENADQVTPQWLTAAMAARGIVATVKTVEVTEQHRGTNANAMLRVTYDSDTDLPTDLFVKLLPTDPDERAAIVRTGMGEKEVLFYQRLADRISMRTPKVLAAEVEPESGAFVVVLEELLSAGCRLPDPDVGVSPAQAMGAMADYANLHHRYLDAHKRADEAAWVVPSRRGSDYGKVRLQQGLDNHRDKLSDPFAELARFYIDHQDAQHNLWAMGEHSVLQGDSHLGNVFTEGDRVGFLDWGLINLGACMRDVSYFITMTLSPENRRQHEAALIREYLDRRAELGAVATTFDQAWLEHRVQAAYTVVASCQIVTFPGTWGPERERFALAFLAKAEAAVADLESRAAIRDLADL